MNRLVSTLCALIALAVSGAGCAHIDRARADRHEERAHREADRGHFRSALHESQKAERLDDKARRDPLP